MDKKGLSEKKWKQNLVLIAKNTVVWLYQLSQKYDRPIQRLDEIPFEELEELNSFGITGIWLVGIWERSSASRKIKRLYGHQDAIASAYSIYEYRISEQLGGEKAFSIFKKNARKTGLKVGCDIVPNHTGIDSPLLVEHPDWYIQSDSNPNSDWKFTLTDLSKDKRVNIKIEDGYYNQSGAAEIFKLVQEKSGEVTYIYHGNDGTSMPWNDTAQLNYLKKEVREASRKIIRDLATKFDIIRLDAAMTLTRQHFKRLWFPEKNGSKFIPTRDKYHLSKAEFDSCMPVEFWKEVIGDLKTIQPNPLLIAEAFWLMEGYFIQEIGMDRVYNSAFMNMLRDEENAKFKKSIRDIIFYNPQSLDHLVNYQTTPDEESAINQFGSNDKYFGICTLSATLPGLPMFGHGQFEGFKERYGMDYATPHFSEKPHNNLIAEHKVRITPLLLKRAVFSNSENFRLYDFCAMNGKIKNSIIAYSNHNGSNKSLVVYNNSKNANKCIWREPHEGLVNKTSKLIDFFTNEEKRLSTEERSTQTVQFDLAPYESRVFNIC